MLNSMTSYEKNSDFSYEFNIFSHTVDQAGNCLEYWSI